MAQVFTINSDRLIELSLGPLNYNEKENVNFTVTSVKAFLLSEVFTSNNYSPIIWAHNYRNQSNFQSAKGFCLDIDKDLTIKDAESILQKENLNYALITTKSHTVENNRFRIFIPFSHKVHTLSNYQAAAHKVDELFGSKCDPNVFDGARFLFGSPKNAYYSSYWNGKDFDVSDFLGLDLSTVSQGDWDNNLVVVDARGESTPVNQITRKTAIRCPFHQDANPSAFIEYSEKSENWFIHCSTCGKTFWKIKFQRPPEERLAKYWSHSRSIYEIGIAGETFYFSEIGEKKFYTLIEARTEEDKEENYEWLVKNHHISKLARIDFLGDPSAKKANFTVLPDEGAIEVRYPAIAIDVQDNGFIERYLEKTFGQYKQFIKEYMAVYAYTNYKKLPTLILVGERGVGKNVFADLIADIFKPLSVYFKPEEGSFNPELQKKLLIADETVTRDVKNYTFLKRLSGQSYQLINEKYTPKYQVRNNTNIILLSNRILPIFTEREELPNSPFNNQFFVYQLKQFDGPIDAILTDKLKDRLGYYVRTELLSVFNGLKLDKSRYSLEVPVTKEEERLFNSSISLEESLCEKFLRDVVEHFYVIRIFKIDDFFSEGLLPFERICKELEDSDKIHFSTADKNKILHDLREHQMIEASNSKRIQIAHGREYCYVMTARMKKRLSEELSGCSFNEQPLEQPLKAA
jgi:hypothetical protein